MCYFWTTICFWMKSIYSSHIALATRSRTLSRTMWHNNEHFLLLGFHMRFFKVSCIVITKIVIIKTIIIVMVMQSFIDCSYRTNMRYILYICGCVWRNCVVYELWKEFEERIYTYSKMLSRTWRRNFLNIQLLNIFKLLLV